MTKRRQTGLVFLRHGETYANRKPHIIGGRTNETRLTPDGHLQSRHAGQLMKALGLIPTVVFSSPAVRTIQTGGDVLDEMGSDDDILTDPRLQELSQGEWTGLLRAEIHTDAVKLQMNEQGLDFKAPGGESMREVGERVADWVHETVPVTDIAPALYLVAAHGVATRSYVARQEGWTHPELMSHTLGNASLTLMLPRGNDWRLAAFDATPDAVAHNLPL